LGLVLTLVLATLTHRWIERPAMDLGKRLTAK
jgi:peptidoglycan/LPS O-acetylase OafA/YrhL